MLQELQHGVATSNQAGGLRHDTRRYVAQGDAVDAGIQRHFARFADEGKVIVIDGHGDGLAVFPPADGFRRVGGKGGVAGREGKHGGEDIFGHGFSRLCGWKEG